MKLRILKHTANAEEVRETEENLRQLLGRPATGPELPQVYRSNLIVRTNRRIDEASSTRAISLSWVARVALPGVVAIVSFFIGLHYYGYQSPASTSVTPFVKTLSTPVIDSLLVEQADFPGSGLLDEWILTIPVDYVREYLLSTGNIEPVAETLTDQEFDDVLAQLSNPGPQTD